MPPPSSLAGSDPTGRPGLSQRVDGASLAIFRIAFGLALAWQTLDYLLSGQLVADYVDPSLHFPYLGFSWVQPFGELGMRVSFVAMTALSLCVAAGVLYRFACAALFLLTAHWFLIDTVYYNNHYYLQVLVCLLLLCVPAHRTWALGSATVPDDPRHETVPMWAVWLIRFQLAVVYVYGGLAKLDPDWLTGVPIRAIFSEHAETSLFGPFLISKGGGLFFAWAGLFLDLAVVPGLLFRRTRPLAFALITLFHLANAYLFRIGVFPWLMIGATTIFFEPDWPRRLWRSTKHARPAGEEPAPRALATFLGLYAVVQLLVPLRHHLYPNRVTWSQEGFAFAWHMMLRHKEARTEFRVHDGDGRLVPLDPQWPISAKQWAFMGYDPFAVLHLAHWLGEEARRQGVSNPSVYAGAQCSLNGREPQLLIDLERDLMTVRDRLAPADWVLPLESEDLPERPYDGRLDALAERLSQR